MRNTPNLRVEQNRQMTFSPQLELDPALSPDGKSLAYVVRDGSGTDIHVRALDGGEETNLTKDLMTVDHRWPQWSPDGTQVAFLASPAAGPSSVPESTQHILYLVKFPGGTPRIITNASMRGFDWSPDGTRLVFIRDREICVSSSDGANAGSIAKVFDPSMPSWSPDGKWIAYVSGNLGLFAPHLIGNLAPSSIAVVSVGGGESHPLTDSKKTNTSPVWLPDSKSLLFVSTSGGGRDVFQRNISESGEGIGEPSRITTGLNALSIDLSSDGRQMAYVLFQSRANLWSLPIPPRGPISPAGAQRITSENQVIEAVSVTPDGKWIAFDSNRSGNQDIYRMARNGTAQQLTTDPHDDFGAAWSPDGESIAFFSYRNGNRDIYVMAADGSNVQQVTSEKAEDRYPHWSPDGESLTFFSDKTGHQEVYIVSREGGRWGQVRQLTRSEGGQFPRWSPDGQSIAYVDVVQGISVISPNGEGLRRLVPKKPLDPRFVAWSPDGKTIYFKAGTNSAGLWSVPLNGGSPTQLVQFNDTMNFARAEFDTDGKEFFFTMAERESDVWMLQLRSKR